MATKTGTFLLRRAAAGARGHVEFEGPRRLAFGDVELAARDPICKLPLPPHGRYQVMLFTLHITRNECFEVEGKSPGAPKTQGWEGEAHYISDTRKDLMRHRPCLLRFLQQLGKWHYYFHFAAQETKDTQEQYKLPCPIAPQDSRTPPTLFWLGT